MEEIENDELNKDTDDDEDAVEDILYMRGASFTIHLDPPPENTTTNSTKINDETGAPLDRVELGATSQVRTRLWVASGLTHTAASIGQLRRRAGTEGCNYEKVESSRPRGDVSVDVDEDNASGGERKTEGKCLRIKDSR